MINKSDQAFEGCHQSVSALPGEKRAGSVEDVPDVRIGFWARKNAAAIPSQLGVAVIQSGTFSPSSCSSELFPGPRIFLAVSPIAQPQLTSITTQ